MVIPPQYLATHLIRRRSPHCLGPSSRRLWNDALAGMGDSGHTFCRRRVRHHPGFGESASFPASWDHLRSRDPARQERCPGAGGGHLKVRPAVRVTLTVPRFIRRNGRQASDMAQCHCFISLDSEAAQARDKAILFGMPSKYSTISARSLNPAGRSSRSHRA
jgi:hypothetical protein